MRIAFVFLAFAILGSGCAVYTHQGIYDVGKAEGWRREASEGTTFFYPPAARNGDGFVALTTEKKGQILLVASFPGKTAKFDNNEVRIIPHDGGMPFLTSISGARIVVSSTSDFRVEIPALMVDGKHMPPIVAELKWSDRKYRAYRTLQDP